MMAKCSDGKCSMEDNIKDSSIIEYLPDGYKRFSFPWLGITVIAKSLDEAKEKVKMIKGYKIKNIS